MARELFAGFPENAYEAIGVRAWPALRQAWSQEECARLLEEIRAERDKLGARIAAHMDQLAGHKKAPPPDGNTEAGTKQKRG